jgi:hypothetical protein
MGTDAGVARANAAQRAAETMLRTLGGGSIQVRVPALVVSGDAAQLGASAAVFEDVEISPVVVRSAIRQQKGREILVAACTLARVRQLRTETEVTNFFETAAGVVVAGKLARIDRVLAEEFAGAAYIYRLVVSE